MTGSYENRQPGPDQPEAGSGPDVVRATVPEQRSDERGSTWAGARAAVQDRHDARLDAAWTKSEQDHYLEKAAPEKTPAECARVGAKREADRQQANGKVEGTSEAVTTADRRFTAVSSSTATGDEFPLADDVKATLDAIPPAERSAFHGKCALPQSLSKLILARIDPRGGFIGSAMIRALNHDDHGRSNASCDSCEHLRDAYDLTEVGDDGTPR